MNTKNLNKGMYALLMAVATMIGITINGSCSADEEYSNTSDYELKTNASPSMLLTEPSQPTLSKSTNNKIFSHDFNLGYGIVRNAEITYVVLADENLTSFRVDTISWLFTPLPSPLSIKKQRRFEIKSQSDGTIRVITAFDIYRYEGMANYVFADTQKDTLNLTATDFH